MGQYGALRPMKTYEMSCLNGRDLAAVLCISYTQMASKRDHANIKIGRTPKKVAEGSYVGERETESISLLS